MPACMCALCGGLLPEESGTGRDWGSLQVELTGGCELPDANAVKSSEGTGMEGFRRQAPAPLVSMMERMLSVQSFATTESGHSQQRLTTEVPSVGGALPDASSCGRGLAQWHTSTFLCGCVH